MSMESFFDIDAGFGVGMLVYYLLSMLFSFGLSIAVYVFRSLGVYTIAKRRALKNPWMAWVPVVDYWLLGSISDQYQYVVKGRVKNKRKALLVLNIILWACVIAIYVLLGVMLVQAFTLESLPSVDHTDLFSILGPTTAMMGISLVMSGISIAVMVIRYIALYDLFYSCDPDSSIAYLLLSIFLSVAQPLFLFLCRKKDEGMPPRKQTPVYIPEPTAEPWENAEE